MLLTISEAEFVQRIKAGIKIHTLREDKHNRWKLGMKIHFWHRNPRNVKLNPAAFGTGICSQVVPIEIKWIGNHIEVRKAGILLTDMEVHTLAYQDGFKSLNKFKKWFCTDFTGKLIYWSDTNFLNF